MIEKKCGFVLLFSLVILLLQTEQGTAAVVVWKTFTMPNLVGIFQLNHGPFLEKTNYKISLFWVQTGAKVLFEIQDYDEMAS